MQFGAAAPFSPRADVMPQPKGDPLCINTFTDAAGDDAPIPSLGGYTVGYWWTHPLTDKQRLLPIAVLEFAAFVINIQILQQLLGTGLKYVEVRAWTDALTARMRLESEKAGSTLMQLVHAQFEKVRADPNHIGLKIGHVFGDGNLAADAKLLPWVLLDFDGALCTAGSTPTATHSPPILHHLA